ncbi:MAG: hypothetical protein PHC88_00145 [Terrimicrobiaceae bacterium]|nr:hypothetical protein [Terrimicrobiaceae bacterium]
MPVIVSALKGRTMPLPEPAKRAILYKYSRKYKPKVFVETGTFRGESVEYLLAFYDQLFTIELAPALFKDAQDKFSSEAKVSCLQGNSTDHLPKILNTVASVALIWLDAHYSGGKTSLGDRETPIMEELDLIFSLQQAKHIILIDDAREFGANTAYPSLSLVKRIAEENHYSFENKLDIIRLVPVPD